MSYWSQNCKKVQGGRGLRRSLVKPSAQSRVCCEMAVGCSRLYPVPSYKSVRMETEQPLGQCIPLLDSLHGEKAFSLYLVWISLVSTYAHCVSSSCYRLLWRACWRILVPSSFPHWTSAPDSDHLGGPLLNLLHFTDVLSGLRLMYYFRYHLTSAE